nr:hypothetical protein [Tanacetum cinerariifolium]
MQKYLLKQQFKGFYVSASVSLHKGYDRFQTLPSQLEIHDAGVSHEDTNHKFLRYLPSSWSQRDVKGTIASSSSNTQNEAFVSADNTSSTNDVSTAYSVSFPSISKSQKEGSASYPDKVIHSFFANQSSSPQLDCDDLEQINDDDLEEMDLKWQVAMISIKIKKFYKKTGRKLQFDTRDTISFHKTKVKCFNCHKMEHFARDCRAKWNQDNKRRDGGYNGNKARDNRRRPASQDDLKALVTINGEVLTMRYAKGMHAVPLPMIGNYMPSGPDVEIDYSQFTYGPKQTSADESNSKYVEFTSSDSDSSVEITTSMPAPVDNAPMIVYKPKEDPHKALKDKGIVDSVCSRHMTGNKAHLADYQEFKGGSITFGGSNDKITGKGKIKAGRFSWVNFLKSKNETTPILKDFIRQAKNQFNHKVKTIRSDNGTKFKNHDFIEFYGLKGIKRQYSNAKTPQQNRVAERKNRTVIEATRTMLADSFLPTTFWAELVNTVCYVLNRVLLTKPQNKTPYELLTGRKPIISYIRPFGCHVTILNTIDQLGKFDGKFDSGFLVGYSLNSKAFRNQANKSAGPQEANNSAESKLQKTTDYKTCKKPVSQVEQIFQEEFEKLRRQEKEANDAFWKEATHETQDVNTNSTNLLNAVSAPVSDAGHLEALNDDESSYLDYPSMPHLEDIYASPSVGIFTDSSYENKCVVTDFNNSVTTMTVSLTPTTRIHTIHPKTQILGDPLSAVQTRSKVHKNFEAHALVYRNKKDERGVIVRNKARLVAQGHRQEEGIDYDEVFAPVARIEAIRIFLAFASNTGFIVYQMDVNSAFLYGTVDEEVYITQPPGFVDAKFPNKVYKVMKALYALHQAPRAWYATLSTFLEKSRNRRGAIDKTLFIKQDKKDIMLVQVMYMISFFA